MKGNEFFKALLQKIGFDDDELNAVVSSGTMQNIDVSDELQEKLESVTLLTLDAAKNNPDLHEHFKSKLYPQVSGELLDRVDSRIHQAARDLLSEEDYNKIQSTQKTQDKVQIFSDLAQKRVTEKIEDPTTKGKIKSLTEEIENTRKLLEQKESEWSQEKNSIVSDTQNKLIKANVLNKIKSYQLAEQYASTPKLRQLVEEAIFEEISQKAVPKFSEDGTSIELYDKKNPELEYYEGSKRIGVDEIIEKSVQPYLKKAESKPQRQTFQPNHDPYVPVDEIPGALKDRLRAKERAKIK